MRCASAKSGPIPTAGSSPSSPPDRPTGTAVASAPSAARTTSASARMRASHRAYPMRFGRASPRRPGIAAGSGPGRQSLPGLRSAGTSTWRSSCTAGTCMNPPVWYLAAVLPSRVRQALPAGTWHLGQGWRSTAAAAPGSAASAAVLMAGRREKSAGRDRDGGLHRRAGGQVSVTHDQGPSGTPLAKRGQFQKVGEGHVGVVCAAGGAVVEAVRIGADPDVCFGTRRPASQADRNADDRREGIWEFNLMAPLPDALAAPVRRPRGSAPAWTIRNWTAWITRVRVRR